MKVKQIKMNKKGTAPKRVTVEMSIDEAGFLAKVVGGFSYNTTKEVSSVLTGEESEEVYSCLTGDLFNHFWDAGVSGWAAGHKPGEIY